MIKSPKTSLLYGAIRNFRANSCQGSEYSASLNSFQEFHVMRTYSPPLVIVLLRYFGKKEISILVILSIPIFFKDIHLLFYFRRFRQMQRFWFTILTPLYTPDGRKISYKPIKDKI